MTRKSIPYLLAAAATLPALAFAQSSVTISGIMDAGIRRDSSGIAGTVTSVNSGQMVGSRLNFIGQEDLGDGWRTGFVLEMGIDLATGNGTNNAPANPASTALAFGRTASVSFGSDSTGYLSAGRQYTPLWAVSASASNDPFYGSWLGGNAVVYSNTVLVSNSLVYSYGYSSRTMLLAAPRQGFGTAIMYGFANAPQGNPQNAPSEAGQQMGFNASYGSGPVFVGYAFHTVRGNGPAINPALPASDLPRLRQQTLSTAYDFGWARFHLGANTGRNDAPAATRLDRRSWHVGATVPFSNQTVRMLYGRASNRAVGNADWRTFQLGYSYGFSKRTSFYAAFGTIDNDANAQTVFARASGTYARGNNPHSYIAGLRHDF